ncbi:MAG: radical SAM protein, partial [Bacteroidia bacterium]
LLEAVANVEGVDWIRLHYAFPSGFPMEVLDVMKKYDNVCKYLDMPLQHISDNMLKSMRRGITKQKTIDIVNEIRDKVPGIALRTTLIAGYPGETEKDHEEMLKWVEETKFERLGIFTYSHEENTHAHLLKDDVSEKVKKQRADAVMKLQQEISYNLNQEKIGKTYKTLIDRKEGPYYIGRSEFDSPDVDNEVLVKASDDIHLRFGDFVNVKINEANDFDLFGELI